MGFMYKEDVPVEKIRGLMKEHRVLLSLLAFLRLESHRLSTGSSWYESKRSIHRSASSLFIASPSF